MKPGGVLRRTILYKLRYISGLFGPLILWNVHIYISNGMKAIGNYYIDHTVFIYGHNIYGVGVDHSRSIIKSRPDTQIRTDSLLGIFTLCESYSQFHSSLIKHGKWFVDGSGLKTFHDSLARCDIRILTCDRDLTGQALGCESLNGAACGSIVGSNDSLNIISGKGKSVLSMLESLFGTPSLTPLLQNDIDITAIDIGLKNVLMSLINKVSIKILRPPFQPDVVTFGSLLNDELGLNLPTFTESKVT